MFLLKIGGSVITEKSRESFFKREVMDRLSNEIKKAGKKIILVHGAGSFGHIYAKRYKLSDGFHSPEQIKGFSLTHEQVQTLNSYVIRSLQNHDIPAISISPHSIVMLKNQVLEKMDLQIFKNYLDNHFMPVTYGDVVLDSKLGFSICSGDLLVYELTKYFKPEKVIFAVDVDGLFTSNPKININSEFIEEIRFNEINELSTQFDSHPDVTGGMGGKIDTIKKIANIGIDTFLLNGNKPDRLYKVLRGEKTKRTIFYGVK
jgi:isopentenyl phosphate kinase